MQYQIFVSQDGKRFRERAGFIVSAPSKDEADRIAGQKINGSGLRVDARRLPLSNEAELAKHHTAFTMLQGGNFQAR